MTAPVVVKDPVASLQQADRHGFASVSVAAIAENCRCDELAVVAAAETLGFPVSGRGFILLRATGRQTKLQDADRAEPRHVTSEHWDPTRHRFTKDSRRQRGLR